LIRSTPPKPTESGKAIVAHYNKVKLLENDLTKELHMEESESFTTISIGLNGDTLATWFFDAVEEVVKKYKILLDLRVDDQEETHRLLKDGEVSACISTLKKPMQSCSAHKIGTMTYRMFVSPKIKDELFPDGFTQESLKNIPVVIYNPKDTLHTQMFKKAFGRQNVEHLKIFVPSVEQYLDAIKRGMGIGMMPEMQCKNLLKEGILADAASPHTVEAPLYFHRWNVKSKPLDMLTKSVLKAELF
jgi:LysR family transcriptional regulator (chromosome initiation inhibitor)